jgi:hypothetical protein
MRLDRWDRAGRRLVPIGAEDEGQRRRSRCLLYMASLPLEANVQFMTIMATAMPYIGRG